jgi:antitoxin component of RelBE/YafQ-DinJ toxin-antitoxin module
MSETDIITVKIDTETKQKFRDNAELEGSTMSVEIRKFIHRYNRRVENSRINHKTVNK